MAVKSIIEVEIDDGAFQKFANNFRQYDELLKTTPCTWDEAKKSMGGTVESWRKLVDLSKKQVLHSRMIADVEKQAIAEIDAPAKRREESAARQARAWEQMAKNAKGFAGSIASATTSLLRWASLTGLISGVLGVGGLLGIDRLAISAGNQRRSSLGLGVTPGEQNSFGVNFGRLVEPGQFLGGVNEALHDVTKRIGLYGAGLSEKDLAGKDTAQVAAELLPALKRLADQTPDKMLGNVLTARHLDQFITLEDLQRLKNTPAGEIAGYGRQYKEDIRGLDLTKQQARAWQDLQVQLSRAGSKIEQTLIIGLTNLAPAITRLSGSFVHLVDAFAASPRIQKFIDDVAHGLEHFAKEMDKPEFLKSVTDFGDKIGKFTSDLYKDLPDIEDFFHTIASLGKAITAPGRWAEQFDKDHPIFGAIDRWAGLGPDSSSSNGPPKPSSGSSADDSSGFGDALRKLFTWGTGNEPAPPSTPPGSASPISYGQPFPGSLGAPLPGSGAIPKGMGSGFNERLAHDFFRSQGWTEAQTAGLLANAKAESGFHTDAFNPAGGGQGALLRDNLGERARRSG